MITINKYINNNINNDIRKDNVELQWNKKKKTILKYNTFIYKKSREL